MSTAGLIGGIGGGLLTIIILLYVGRTKGAELSRRRTAIFGVAGVIFLVLGLSLVIAKGEALLAIAMLSLLFGVTCLMFCEVYRTLRQLQESVFGESRSNEAEQARGV